MQRRDEFRQSHPNTGATPINLITTWNVYTPEQQTCLHTDPLSAPGNKSQTVIDWRFHNELQTSEVSGYTLVLVDKEATKFLEAPQYARAVWKRCTVDIFHKHDSCLTSSIGSSSSCGKQGASTPMRKGVGEQLTSSMLAGSTGMKVCCQVNG